MPNTTQRIAKRNLRKTLNGKGIILKRTDFIFSDIESDISTTRLGLQKDASGIASTERGKELNRN